MGPTGMMDVGMFWSVCLEVTVPKVFGYQRPLATLLYSQKNEAKRPHPQLGVGVGGRQAKSWVPPCSLHQN